MSEVPRTAANQLLIIRNRDVSSAGGLGDILFCCIGVRKLEPFGEIRWRSETFVISTFEFAESGQQGEMSTKSPSESYIGGQIVEMSVVLPGVVPEGTLFY